MEKIQREERWGLSLRPTRLRLAVIMMIAVVSWSVPGFAGSNTQTAHLYELQAAYHAAVTVRDPVNGDSAAVIDQRIRDMLSLWADDGSLTLQVGGALDGTYAGQGDPEDPPTCPAPSGDPTNRGTLCTFFKYVAAPFQPANKFVSLAPSYLTQFGIHGKDATIYFQCHLFNVAINPATDKPFWTQAGHLGVDGSATKVHGDWLLLNANVAPVGIPIP